MQGWYTQGRYNMKQDGQYSITGSYNALVGQHGRLKIAELIWTALAQPKHRIIVWLAVQGRLLTKDRPRHLHIPVEDETCRLCTSQAVETPLHLSAECDWIGVVREGIQQRTGITIRQGEVHKVLEGIKRRQWKQFHKELIAAIWGAVVYHVWKARNRKIFRGTIVNWKIFRGTIDIERIELLKDLRKASSCHSLLHKLLCN